MNSDTRFALSSVAEIVSTKVAVASLAGHPYVSTENLLPNLGGLGEGELPDAERVNAFRKSDTLFSNIRPYFRKVHYAPAGGGCSADVLVFRSKDPQEFWPPYLYYCLADPTFIDHTMATCKGAKMPRGDKGAMLQYQVSKPDLDLQKRVSSILRSLDESVLTLQHQNTALEDIAQRLFRSWFVNFDPVHAKAAGKEPEAMSAELASLFPSEFEDSALGPIPKGWTVTKVKNILEMSYGKSLVASARKKGPIPVYGSGGLAGFHDTPLVQGPSIIVGRKGTIGTLYWEDAPFYPIDTVFYVKPLTVPLTYCYQVLGNLRLSSMNTDAAVPGLNRENVYRLNLVLPAVECLEKFNELAASNRKLIHNNILIIRCLSLVRDHLLPRLISGKLSLAQAQCAIEEALPA